jgi:DNA-binding NtrC family response regulator
VEKNVLIIDDEKAVRSSLRRLFAVNNIAAAESTGTEALDQIEKERPSVVLLDIKMPDIDGLELLPCIKSKFPCLPVIMLTGYGDIPTAVRATKLGAYDFLLKPADEGLLLRTVDRAHERFGLENEKRRLEGEVIKLNSVVDMSLEWQLGRSEAMKTVMEQIYKVAWSDFSVIIEGETGTGKSLIANIIHNMSKGIEKPFVRVDVGALPESLIESELFGHEKGAFTGANRKKKGYFETADGGTLFIDELENISPLMQSKLLGVVESRKLFPVGSAVPVDVNVRIIAATNNDIKRCVDRKEFREDLYFRLGEFIIDVPPLRERAEDIAFFAERFFREVSEEIKKPLHEISEEAHQALKGYSWPGNVRELKNVIRRAALLSSDGVIRPENLNIAYCDIKEPSEIMPLKDISAMVLRDAESKAIRQALKQTSGNKTKAAKLLKIDYTTLFAKLKEYNIK